MANQVSRERLYLTKDGTRVVKEGDPDAASLFVAAGLEVAEADVKKYGLQKYVTDAGAPYDAVADHEARHTPADAPVAEDELKGLAPQPNKAKATAENK